MHPDTPAVSLPDSAVSYWVDSTDQPAHPHLAEDVAADVAVVGAGIAGFSTATFLAEDGHSVVLLDANGIATKTTGHTAAKVTVAHGLRYNYLIDTFGEEKAKLYADANRTALEEVSSRVADQSIDCAFRRAPAYSYVPPGDDTQQIEDEVTAARRLGLDAKHVEDVPAPVDVAAGIRYDEQAHFHPRAYLLSLLETFEAEGGRVYGNTRARDIEYGPPHRLETPEGQVKADDIVVATHYPFVKRMLYLPRTLPGQEHIITVNVEGEPPEGMYYNAGTDLHSFRPVPTQNGTMLLVEGKKHPTGIGEDTMELTRQVQSFATSHFPVEDITHRWSAQDFMTMDRVPYMGPISPFSESVYVVTGFGGWGMTHGTVAGLLLSDLIAGRDNEWAELYTPNRMPPLKSLKRLPNAGAKMMKQFIKGHRNPSEEDDLPPLDPGEGTVVARDNEPVGVYRDASGEWHAVSGSCTYSGCVLRWNGAGESWDCPCDGSRYNRDGTVIDGPAQEDLAEKPVPRSKNRTKTIR
ncbi:FAD-dependent oxidoreductase [Halorarius halobius]|uniref:FAD-dependent oxidoreductase n=1 Tax=Halorarius halobius TaxID=2962671 RepID=UPI0020CED5DA|nr:FAD-dependent oxidoreductase [Halorarius halobius]